MERRKNYEFTRQDILGKAYHDFLTEVYERAQPSLDINKYLEDAKAGKIKPKEENPPLYDRHYMQHELIKYISEKYKEAYRIKEEWKEDCDVVIRDLTEGGTVDKYIDEHIDENGNHHPGYRGYDDRPPISKLLKDALSAVLPDDKVDAAVEKAVETVIKRIKEIRDFYRFDSDETRWQNTVWLGSTPSSNKEKVKEYYKSIGQDIELKDIPEEDFWYIDNGWTDEEIAEDKADYQRTCIDDMLENEDNKN